MHPTRIAAFLLGAWIAGCVFVDLIALQNVRMAGQMLNAAIPAASEIIQDSGRDEMNSLLHHFAAEQYRSYFSQWEVAQLAIFFTISGVLFFATEKRWLPQLLCAAIVVVVVFQLAIHPEWIYRGREADFPPGSLSRTTQSRVSGLNALWTGVEIAKLILGAILSVFVFSYKPRRRPRRTIDPVFLVKAN